MTENLRSDIAAAAALLPSTLGSKREIRKLVEHLWEGERVEQLSTGMYGKGNGILVRTDRRLLFLVDGWTGATSEDFPFSRISSVQWSSGMLMGSVTIFASGNKAEIKNVHKEIGKSVVDVVRSIISQPAATAYAPPQVPSAPAPAGGADVFEQLRKLGDLRDAGIVTAAEFEAKKAELLARL
jgi:hypothetical protein